MARQKESMSTIQSDTTSKSLIPSEVIEANPVGRPTLYKPEYCQKLIAHMSQGFSFESFAGEVDAGRKTIYSWADRHEEFRHAKEIGEAKLLIFYETVLRNVAMGLVPQAPKGALATRGNATAAIFMVQVHGRKAGYNQDGVPFFEEKDAKVTFEYVDSSEKKKEITDAKD